MKTRLISVMVAGLMLWGCSHSVFEDKAAESEWQTNFEEATKAAKESGKYIFVNFSGSDWCGWCIRLDKEVLSKQVFSDYAKDSLVLVELDFPKRKPQSDELKKQNSGLMKTYGVSGFPTVLILSPQGDVVARTGYRRGGAEDYVKYLEGVIDKHKADKE
jgi:protein disulfide-isomerase